MKHLKSILKISLLIATMMLSTLAVAQPQGQRGQQGRPSIPDAKQIEKMVDKLSSELTLSEEQTVKIQAIYTSHFDKVDEATKNGRPNREDMQKLRSNFETEVKNELSEEQQKAYDEFLEKQRQERGKRGSGKR